MSQTEIGDGEFLHVSKRIGRRDVFKMRRVFAKGGKHPSVRKVSKKKKKKRKHSKKRKRG